MGKLNVTRVIAFIMIAVVSTAFVTACGDGKSKRRTKTNRDLNEKPAADAPATADADKDAPATDTPADGDKPADDQTTVTGDQDALKKKTESLEAISTAMKELSDAGTMVDKNQLEDGKYKLTQVVSALRYIYKQEDARGMQTLSLNEVGDGDVQLAEVSTSAVGVVAEHQLAARGIEIALSFSVKKENGAFSAVRGVFSPAVLNTSVTNQLAISTSLAESAADASVVKSSMIDMLSSTAQGTSDITYSMNDENNRTLIMRMRKVSETELRVVIRVDEETAKDSDAKTYTLAREIVLTYSIEKAVAEVDNTVVLSQPDQPVAPPVTTDQLAKDDDIGKGL